MIIKGVNKAEMKAIEKLYDYMSMNIESAPEDYENFYLTIHEQSDGSEMVHYYDGNKTGSVIIPKDKLHI